MGIPAARQAQYQRFLATFVAQQQLAQQRAVVLPAQATVKRAVRAHAGVDQHA